MVVPSYGRPDSLEVCLEALAAQSRQPDEVIVVTRADDDATRALVAARREQGSMPLQEEIVAIPGQVGALAAGCDVASGDLVAITDDDAAPRADWVERLQQCFADPSVIGAGGRDAVTGTEADTGSELVGTVRWYGKVIGNHHLGVGPARDVDVLKGVNMAYRRDRLLAQGFDPRLRGSGAQVHNDLKLCLSLRREGARLVYDPETIVDHMPAERPEGDHRVNANSQQQVDEVHNETLALLEFLPPLRRAVFVAWALAVGRGPAPGLAHTIWTSVRRRGGGSWALLLATLRGRRAGWRTYRRTDRRPAP